MTVINSSGQEAGCRKLLPAARPIASISNRPSTKITSSTSTGEKRQREETRRAVHARKYRLCRRRVQECSELRIWNSKTEPKYLRIKERNRHGALARGNGKPGTTKLGLSGGVFSGHVRDSAILIARAKEKSLNPGRPGSGNKSNVFLFLSRGDVPYTRGLFVCRTGSSRPLAVELLRPTFWAFPLILCSANSNVELRL